MLYSQLHEGLKYEIVRAPGVTGVDSYASLCLAARNEERRLLELKRHQQYQRQNTKTPAKTPPKSRPADTAPEKQTGGRDPEKLCFICNKRHFASKCPERKSESRGRPVKADKKVKQVSVADRSPSAGTVDPELAGVLLSDSDDSVRAIRLQDSGSATRAVVINLQGVPATGVVDSGSDLTIINGELFAKVALAARLKKRDLKKPDKVPRTYDQRVFALDGHLDLDVEFDGKCLCTPVYVRKKSADPLLLSEGVCRQLGIIQYHPDVCTVKQLTKNPQVAQCQPQVPVVRVGLVETVRLLPHQSRPVPVVVDGKSDDLGPLLIESCSVGGGSAEMKMPLSILIPMVLLMCCCLTPVAYH